MARVLEVSISNRSKVPWYRIRHKLTHGTWRTMPPEALGPHTLGVTRLKASSEVALELQYGFVLRGVLYFCVIETVAKSGSLSARVGCAEKTLSREAEAGACKANDILTASCLSDDQRNMVVVVLGLTQQGGHFAEECLTELMMKEQRMLSDWTNALRHPPGDWGRELKNGSLKTDEADPELTPVDAEEEDSIGRRSSCAQSDDIPLADANLPYKLVLEAVTSFPALLLNRLLLANMRRRLPSSFEWIVSNQDWHKLLRSEKQSMYIRVVNNTSHVMLLVPASLGLEDCTWVEFPSTIIPPHGGTEFGVMTSAMARGYKGKFVYRVEDDQERDLGELLFQFEFLSGTGRVKSLGLHRNSSMMPDVHFTIEKCSDNLNEATLAFHVMDHDSRLYLQIITARALPSVPSGRGSQRPNFGATDFHAALLTWTALHTDRGHDLTSKLNSMILADTTTLATRDRSFTSETAEQQTGGPGVVVASRKAFWFLPLFETLPTPKPTDHERAMAGRLVTGDVHRDTRKPELVFFRQWRLQSVRALLTEVGLGGEGLRALYMEYKIGCEIFRNIWDYFDTIDLNAAKAGGISEDRALLLSSSFIDVRQALPPPTLPPLCEWQNDLVSGALVEPLSHAAEQHYGLSRPRLLQEVAHKTLRTFSKGLQKWLMENIPPKPPGTTRELMEWVEICNLPGQFVWKDSGRTVVDCEGLLFVMSLNWGSGLDSIFPEGREILHPLSVLSSCWTAQDLSELKEDLVVQAATTAETILRRVGDPVAASEIEHYGAWLAREGKTRSYRRSFQGLPVVGWSVPTSSPIETKVHVV